MKVGFAEAAEFDLESIGDWIAKDNPRRAATFVGELRKSCLDIGTRPTGYPLIEHRRSDGVRRKVYGNYLIFYRLWNDAVEILHVLHGAWDYTHVLFPEDELD